MHNLCSLVAFSLFLHIIGSVVTILNIRNVFNTKTAWSLNPVHATKCCVSSFEMLSHAFTPAAAQLLFQSSGCLQCFFVLRSADWKTSHCFALRNSWVTFVVFFVSLSICTVKLYLINFAEIWLNLSREDSVVQFTIHPPTQVICSWV